MEPEREGKGGKSRKINCCFIMFSSDMTLAVIMAGQKISLEKSHSIHKLKVNGRSISHGGPFMAPLPAVVWRSAAASQVPNEMFLLKLIT